MNERDRLIELLQSVPTNHYGNISVAAVADHLIAHNVTIPPVSVGQTIYLIRRPLNNSAFISECTVRSVTVEHTEKGVICWLKNYNFEVCDSDVGKTVFLTREEAEQALKERSESNV